MKKRSLAIAAACAVLLGGVSAPALSISTPAAVTASAAADYGSETLESYAYQVAALVNREREAAGLAPLKYSDKLSEAAIVRADEIQSYFSHTRPNGTSCFTAMTEQGIRYRYAGENIAYGQRSPEEVMNGWMNSSGHRANILSTNVDYIGVGVAYRNGGYYWTQFFAASDDLTGQVIELSQPDTAPVETVQTTVQTTVRTTVKTTEAPAVSTVTTAAAPAETVTLPDIPGVPETIVTITPEDLPELISGGSCGGIKQKLIQLLLDRCGIDLSGILK